MQSQSQSQSQRIHSIVPEVKFECEFDGLHRHIFFPTRSSEDAVVGGMDLDLSLKETKEKQVK